eukprot:CAMPEP_0203934938 /NCGR_PEP_ID=MMETSP0359-20131031/72783_1 /ASSEMBLY_ACC=CAM_ASM_000338 /TAXON_ID=268821 /ORGANISM="Scrippsiella Hangoei, Strain SHTV-5" /LENGTH=54 /DNA_ID=CAMNT_0050864709 /DNA_START=67 /DNA_END=229 /DNA_ORIENTATION=-
MKGFASMLPQRRLLAQLLANNRFGLDNSSAVIHPSHFAFKATAGLNPDFTGALD